jgi:hypothetical protein
MKRTFAHIPTGKFHKSNTMMIPRHTPLLLAMAAMLFHTFALHAADAPMPDFTKGDAIPARAKHDWNLGATGLRGWMHTGETFSTTTARQIKITAVAEGSPGQEAMKPGDVILGVGGKAFSYDPRTEFGKALTLAESETGKLVLTRWRGGKTEDVTLTLPVLGCYSATAPFDCRKSSRLREQGCAMLARRMAEASYDDDQIVRSLNALALLAGGKKEYLPLVKREAQRAADLTMDDYQSWYYGYAMMLVAEYKLATGDDSVLPGLRRLALETAAGQSAVGSWGHGFARPDGRLGGYGMMNATGLPLTIGLVLARAAGVDEPKVAAAIERSARLLRFYTGKGGIPYGDHHPWTEGHEDNGKCGMAAVLFNLMGEPPAAEFFARMSLSAHSAERDCGHTGNYFNILWAMPGVALSGPQATGAWMKEFGMWYFDLARRWDGGFSHLGPPEPEHDSYEGWDATGCYLLALAVPEKNLWLTGKRTSQVPQLTAAQAESYLAPGRGWRQTDRTSAYEKRSDDELLAMLGSWSPILRGRAAAALAKREAFPVAKVQALLDSPSLEARLGACQAIEEMGGRAAAAVPALRKALQSGDLWLTVKAADALVAIGEPAAVAVPELLELLVRPPAEDDPRAMLQRFLIFAVFDSGKNLLSHSLDNVNREQLHRAVRSGLKNQDGRARSGFGTILRRLPLEQVKPLLPAILEAVTTPAPSGEMFADGIRLDGLRVLASHHIEEGIQACANYLREQSLHASESRTAEIMEIFTEYGAHARAVIPQLEATAADFADGEPDFPEELSKRKAADIRKAIAKIKAATARPELRSLN